MEHGIDGYFCERTRFGRRLAFITILVAGGSIGGLWLSQVPIVQRWTKSNLRAVRFGYEGPNQFVERINLMSRGGTDQTLTSLGKLEPQVQRRGGDQGRRKSSPHPHALPVTRPDLTGTGDSERDLVARAISRLANVPVVQSEDLVIDVMVEPVYPPTLIEKNVEGKVMVQALIDTTGRVVDVRVVSSTGQSLFERAAQEAVWQCRFRPYRLGGKISEVYAVFRFSFRIYSP